VFHEHNTRDTSDGTVNYYSSACYIHTPTDKHNVQTSIPEAGRECFARRVILGSNSLEREATVGVYTTKLILVYLFGEISHNQH